MGNFGDFLMFHTGWLQTGICCTTDIANFLMTKIDACEGPSKQTRRQSFLPPYVYSSLNVRETFSSEQSGDERLQLLVYNGNSGKGTFVSL